MEFKTTMKRANDSPKRSKSMGNLKVVNGICDDFDFLSRTLEEFHYGTLRGRRRSISESSVEICFIYDTESEEETPEKAMLDNGDRTIHTADAFTVLEQKIDKLNDIFVEQSRLLSALRDDMARTNEAIEQAVTAQAHAVTDALNSVFSDKLPSALIASLMEAEPAETARPPSPVSARAQALLDALNLHKRGANNSLDSLVANTLNDFLQSEDLRRQMVSSTMECVKGVVRGCFREEVLAGYLPLLERSHCRLLRHVTNTLNNAFRDKRQSLEYGRDGSGGRAGRQLRAALQRHQRLLAAPAHLATHLQQVLKKELSKWRESVTEVAAPARVTSPEVALPPSPPQPAHPTLSAIDQLMSAAEINNKLQDGDVNGSFEKALSASDLSLVMAACRAADPERVFAPPCSLEQPVLLSLVQQLATDMVHDSQLKCRYLEEALINLDTNNEVTRSHLPTVIKEVCGHLYMFLNKYPHHMYSRRIKMIILATGSLFSILDETVN